MQGRSNTRSGTTLSYLRLDALKRLRLPTRPRAERYQSAGALHEDRDAVPWYWRLLAVGATFMILGGFLMLPATFNKDPQLRISQAALGIFAVAILTAGFSLTGLLTYAVRSPRFQSDGIYLPSLTSCSIGLLTVIYNFIISPRYVWNTPALLITIAGILSLIAYSGLLFWTQRRITSAHKATTSTVQAISLQSPTNQRNDLWQNQAYYDNYVRNMFPTSLSPSSTMHRQQSVQSGASTAFVSEDEMQRQQMLQLLQKHPNVTTPSTAQSTFRIDWQGAEQEDQTPATVGNGVFFAADRGSVQQTPVSVRGWDNVWRGQGRPPEEAAVGRVRVVPVRYLDED